MPDFIPQNEGELILWLGNFQNKLTTSYGASLGYTHTQLTDISNACNSLVSALNVVEAAKKAFNNAVGAKDKVKLDQLWFLKTEIRKIKGAYTDAIGKDLGIIGTNDEVDEETVKPKFSGQAFPGYVRLKFSKNGLDGVNIYSRLKGQSSWGFLLRDINSPYDDHKAIANGAPETGEYMCIGIMEDT